MRTDAERLAARDHPDPHAFLGPHAVDGAVVVRAFRPEADTVVVRPSGAALERVHAGGLFEGVIDAAALARDYRFEVAYPDGNVFDIEDPYRFASTVSEADARLFGEGRHPALHERLGAHVAVLGGVPGTAFAVWAPAARSVSVVGDFNSWDGRLHPMRALGTSGIWELFVPGARAGQRYKFEIRAPDGSLRMKADPFAFAAEASPGTDSVVDASTHVWEDGAWMAARRAAAAIPAPMSVYEVHLGSWGGSSHLPELASELAEYVAGMGFTHVELLPVMAHPFAGSWGYQVTSYFAPAARLGTPDDLRAFVDRMHARGIGVILDWVPAHFPRDDWALAQFDGTALYEHADPQRGAHPDWGTLVFDLGRPEVRNFLLASALFWAREFHADGLRVDAVSSMLYLDHAGGRPDPDAVTFLSELTSLLEREEPGVVTAAEEATAWPGVTDPVDAGGLGFGLKWNMGWAHDTLGHFRSEQADGLTVSLAYAFDERFVLPLSHDEGSLLGTLPGDREQQLAGLRCLYAYMWAYPGRKLLFMGQELAQARPWNAGGSLDWHLLEEPGHAGVQTLLRDLNTVHRATPALWEADSDPRSFAWLGHDEVVAFARSGVDPPGDALACVCNPTTTPRSAHRIGLPRAGRWTVVVDTSGERYGGSRLGAAGAVSAEPVPWQGQPCRAELEVPPLGALWLKSQS